MDLMGRGDGCTWVQPTPKLDTHHFPCADWADTQITHEEK